MKIITKCVIDMGSLEVIEEESYEYDGPVAHCGGGSSGATELSGAEVAIRNDASMLLDALRGQATLGQGPAYAMPDTPYFSPDIDSRAGMDLYDKSLTARFDDLYDPQVQGLINWEGLAASGVPANQWDVQNYNLPTGARPTYGYDIPGWNAQEDGYNLPDWYDLPGYNLADPSNLQPSQQWYGNLSPEIMAGMNAPYTDARQQLLEDVQSRGMLGSQRGGYSGSAAAALGKFEADRANQMGLSAWQMTQPGLQTAYGSEQTRNQALYQDEISRQQGMVNAKLGRNIWGAESTLDQGRTMAEWQLQQNLTGAQLGQEDFGWDRQAQLDQAMRMAQEGTRAGESQQLRSSARYDQLFGASVSDLQRQQAQNWEMELLQNQLGQRGAQSDWQYLVGRQDAGNQYVMQLWQAELERARMPYLLAPSYIGGSTAIPGQGGSISPMAGAIGGGMTGALAGAQFGDYMGYGKGSTGMNWSGGIGGLLGMGLGAATAG